jgi:hypothetical protein
MKKTKNRLSVNRLQIKHLPYCETLFLSKQCILENLKNIIHTHADNYESGLLSIYPTM